MVRAGPNTAAAASTFFEETQDLFLVQHVHAATRYRAAQEPSMLDYIFTTTTV